MHRNIVIERNGPASTLQLRPTAPRTPGDNEVSIDVAYSGINLADVHMRLGLYPDAPKKPFVPGFEVSGKIAAIGKQVRDLRIGDAVIAATYYGGYASSVTIHAQQVFKLPTAFDLAAGAALPVAYFTTQLALFEMARVRAGDRVLIECGTGGVGVLATQMARHVGAEVTGLTTTPHKKAFIENLGAKPYTLDEFRRDRSLAGYDFILNASGGGNVRWQRERLGMTGRMVCIDVSSRVKDGKRSLLRAASAVIRMPRISVLKLINANSGIYGLSVEPVLRDPAWIARLARSIGMIDQMGARPHIGKVFAASDVASAHLFLETKQATGKVLLQW